MPDAERQEVRPSDLADVRSVIVDANVMGRRGDLRVDLLRRLNEIASRDGHLEVLVPEPVLWEWQEHAARAYVDAARSLTETASRLSQAGLELPVMSLSTDEIHSAVQAAVSGFRHVRIVPLGPEHAIEALRDQILVRPPGERIVVGSKTVKTGASDSAWIRAVHAKARGQSRTYVVLSNDKDVATAYEHWGSELPLVLPSVNALAKLFEGSAFPALSSAMVSNMIAHLLGEDWYSPAFDIVDEGNIVTKTTLGEEIEYLDTALYLHQITAVAGFSDLSVVDRIGSVQGTLYLIGDVDVTGWRQNPNTDHLDAHDSGSFQCVLRTPALLAPTEDEPSGFLLTFEDSSAAHLLTGEWSTSEDALDALLEALGTLPGCDVPNIPEEYVLGDRLSYDCVSSQPLELFLDRATAAGAWRATASHGGVSVVMSCELVDSNYFSDTWTMRGEVSGAGGESLRVEDPWSGVSYLFASFADREAE